MHRHGLLLTAVATVTVPGLLAVFSVVGHEHIAVSAARVTTTAGDGSALPGPLPVSPATARTSARNDVAAVRRASDTPVTVLSRMTASQRARGIRMLNQAAAAGLATSYQGTELISQSGVDGSTRMTSQVWHSSGGQTLVQTSSAASPPAASAEADSSAPEGVFGVTRPLVAQLDKHYVAIYQGRGSAAGRPTAVVALYRSDGSLAARYWLDRQTNLPLRRELFDTVDKVISEDSFVRVQFGAPAESAFAAGAVAALSRPRSTGQAQPAQESAWVTETRPRLFRASLASQGWHLPGTLAAGLPLYAAAWDTTKDGKVVDLEYSDGLYVVSLFVQRGSLAPQPQLTGWRPVSVHGQQAYVMGHAITWTGLGFVYTIIADAPPQTVTQVVGSMPRSASPGLLDRLGRGFIRLANLVNPFR